MKPAALGPINISVLQIVTGRDTDMPRAELHWGESVTYVLGPVVRALFHFKPKNEVMKLMAGTRNVHDDVDISLSEDYSTLTLTIKPDTEEWSAKATFFFRQLGGDKPNSGGLDPEIDNKGRPMPMPSPATA